MVTSDTDDEAGFDAAPYVAAWLRKLVALDGRSQRTAEAYRRDLRQVGEHLAAVVGCPPAALPARELTADQLEEAFSRWATQPPKTSSQRQRAAASQRRAWSAFSSLCAWLVDRGELAGNPMGKVGKPRQPQVLPRRIQTDAAVRRLLHAAGREPDDPRSTRWPARDRALVAVCVFLGLRVSELTELDRGSVSRDRDGTATLLVRGKGDKDRAVPMPDVVAQTVAMYLADREGRHGPLPEVDRSRSDDQALFVHVRTGRRMSRSQVEHLVDQLYRLAGIAGAVPANSRVHALRHQAAFSWLEGGADVTEVKDLLGHASLDTTYRYVKADPRRLRGAVGGHPDLDALG